MKTLKRIFSIVIASAILATGMAVGATEIGAMEESIVPKATSQTNIASWGTYLYFSDAKGVNIYNLATEETVASWSIESLRSKFVAELSGFVPSQIEVSDDYIVMASKPIEESAYIVVFKNEGSYDNDIPPILAMMKNFHTPVIRLNGNKLVVSDCVAEETINNARIQVEKNGIAFWVIDLDRHSEFSGNKNGVGLTSTAVKNMRESGIAHLFSGYGTDSYMKADYLWKQMDINDGVATFVTYNDKGFAPYGALMLHKINLETEETSVFVVEDGDISGLVTILDTEEPIAEADVLALNFCISNDRSATIAASAVGDGNVFIEELEGGKTRVYIGADGLNKFGDLNVTREQLISGNILVSLIYNETEYQMVYKNVFVPSAGTVSTKDGYSYLISNIASSKDNKLWVVREDGSVAVNGEDMFDFGNNSGWLTSVVAGDKLVGFLPNVNNNFGALDISDPENIVANNTGGQLFTGNGVVTNNEFGRAVINSSYIYYPIADNKGGGAGIIKTDIEEFSADLFYREGILPILIYGKASNTETVEINIDGTDYVIDTANGVYSFPIYKIESGVQHTAVISALGNEETLNFTVTVPENLILENIVFDESGFEADITNDTNKGDGATQSFTILLASYDENGDYADSRTGTVIAPYGQVTNYERSTVPTVPEGGTLKIMLLDGNRPICSTYEIKDGVITHNVSELIAGKNSQPTLEIVENATEGNVKIKGNDTAGNRVFIKISIGSKTIYCDQIYCDAEGNYEYIYDYSEDGHSGEYTVLAGASNQVVLKDSFNTADPEELEALFGEISGMSGSQLHKYLSDNPDKAEMLSIDLSDENFVSLSSDKKLKVMDEVAKYINEGNEKGISDKFTEATEEQVKKQKIDNALYALNKAADDKIYDILKANKDLFEIDGDVWEEYVGLTSNSTMFDDVNELLSKYDFEKISDVSKFIVKAIEKAGEGDEPESGTIGGSGGGGGGGGGGGSSSGNGGGGNGGGQLIATPPQIIDPFTPVEAKDIFSDLASVPWAKDSIHGLYMAGVVDGVGNGLFMPNASVTREQFVKMIINAFDIEMADEGISFNDVNRNEWYYPYVKIAASVGLSKGDDNGNFGVGQMLSREDAAVFVSRALTIAGMTIEENGAKTEFTDSANISVYAKAAVSQMQAAGIITGDGSGAFAPKGICTRAMAAKIIYGLMSAAR